MMIENGSSATANPSEGINNTPNTNMNYIECSNVYPNPNMNTVCNVNNVNNTACAVPQGGLQPSLYPGQYTNQPPGHDFVHQSPQNLPQFMPVGQNNPTSAVGQPFGQTHEYHTPAGVQVPAPPPYTNVIYNMLRGLEQSFGQKLTDIEAHLQTQNQRWVSVESQLEKQNSRMNNIEQQLSQINIIKQSVSNTNARVETLGTQVNELHSKVSEYDQSILTYSDLYDDVIKANTENDSVIKSILGRVKTLENCQSKNEERLTEIQWRSMRENLIFTGISEPPPSESGVYEDAELTLRTFLREDMHITRHMEFDRVHRLGRKDPQKNYPRPIIAKFERYKDKEYVRQTAPDALLNTIFGVREQFPQEILETGNLLYPLAKKARQNTENKVRLVRDKLYVNGEEVKPDNSGQSKSYKSSWKPEQRRYENKSGNGREIRSRTVYAKRRPQPYQPYQPPQTKPDKPNKNPLIDWQNRYGVLSDMRSDLSDTGSTSRKSTKNKASSPVDRDLSVKKHKEDQSDQTDTESETDDQMVTEAYSESQNNANENRPHDDDRDKNKTSQSNNASFTASDRSLNNYSDSNSGNKSDSGSYIGTQTTTQANSAAKNDNVSTKYPDSDSTEAINMAPSYQTTQTPSATPSKPVSMPAFREISNELYYGPPVVSQPVASPPLGGTNNLQTYSQTLMSQNSGALNLDTGNNTN